MKNSVISDPIGALCNSAPLGSRRRIGIDPSNGDIVIFSSQITSGECTEYRGFVTPWRDLDAGTTAILIKAFGLDRKGNILGASEENQDERGHDDDYEQPSHHRDMEVPHEESIEYSEIERSLRSNDRKKIGQALVDLGLYDKNLNRATKIIFEFAEHEDDGIRAMAILCIGHIVRLHGIIPIHPTLKLVQKAVDDLNPDVREYGFATAHQIDLEMPELGKLIERDFVDFYGPEYVEFCLAEDDDEGN